MPLGYFAWARHVRLLMAVEGRMGIDCVPRGSNIALWKHNRRGIRESYSLMQVGSNG